VDQVAKKSQSNSRAKQQAGASERSEPADREPTGPKLDPLSTRREARTEARTRGRSAAGESRRRKKRIRQVALIVVAVLAVGFGSVFAYQRITYVAPGVSVDEVGQAHVEVGTIVDNYNTDPPTSGDHYASSAPWGIHNVPIQNEYQVHNLEHGGIVIQYNDSITPEELATLESITSQCDVKLLLAPRPDMEQRISLTAWTYYLNLDVVDRDVIQDFIDAHVDKGPEKLASESSRWNDCN